MEGRTSGSDTPAAGKGDRGGPDAEARRISRKTFIGQMGFLLGACLTGCTPVKIILRAYPTRFGEDPALLEEYLRSFAVTVIPGAPADDPNLVRIYTDGDYPFHSHCGFFVSDLARRSAELWGEERFPLLDTKQRTRVIQDGLAADAITSRLYQGAIFMAQVSFFGSIYDDSRGCALIGYPGTEVYHSPDELYYPDTPRLLATEATADGNFA